MDLLFRRQTPSCADACMRMCQIMYFACRISKRQCNARTWHQASTVHYRQLAVVQLHERLPLLHDSARVQSTGRAPDNMIGLLLCLSILDLSHWPQSRIHRLKHLRHADGRMHDAWVCSALQLLGDATYSGAQCTVLSRRKSAGEDFSTCTARGVFQLLLQRHFQRSQSALRMRLPFIISSYAYTAIYTT